MSDLVSWGDHEVKKVVIMKLDTLSRNLAMGKERNNKVEIIRVEYIIKKDLLS